MDFAVKTVVFILLVVEVLGRTVPNENVNLNGTEDNISATETPEENSEDSNGTAIDENNESDSREDVCPTPQCADRTCRVETPPGHLCPTCICDGHREQNDFEPHSQPSEESGFETRNTTEDRESTIVSKACNGPFDNSSTQTECNSSNHELESAITVTQRAHNVLKYPGNVIMGEDMEHYIQNSSLNKESESADSSMNDIQDAIPSLEKGPRRKRSTNSQTVSPAVQQRWTVLQQDQLIQNIQDSGESDELERESIDENNEGYDELKIFKEGSETEDSESNEITDLYNEESIIWEKEVPGCPTPLCENSSCRIGIPPGHRCPTCICTRSGHDRQP